MIYTIRIKKELIKFIINDRNYPERVDGKEEFPQGFYPEFEKLKKMYYLS